MATAHHSRVVSDSCVVVAVISLVAINATAMLYTAFLPLHNFIDMVRVGRE